MSIWVISKSLKTNYLAKKGFIVLWPTEELVKDYHDLYLKCDVLLLANVFEKFRNNSLKNYKLCRSYYLSTPNLSWDAMFKMTKIELELIVDPNMYIFLKKGIRGRTPYISNRYSKANNKYLNSYDPKE